jgi:uncharacterized protein YqjF (DUF2071 family)
MPTRRWVWRQRWDCVLFLHYRVPAAALRPWVPKALEIEEHSGSAWVSVVPFRMVRVRPRCLPSLSWVSDFAELNVRTYVTFGSRPGVFFLRIEAAKRAAAWLARHLSPLPYEHAPIHWRNHAAGVSVQSPRLAVDFAQSGPDTAVCDPLDHFLTERYCLYAAHPGGVLRAEVHHAPWPLSSHRVRLRLNQMLDPLNVARPLHPDRSHFSAGVEVVAWSSERIAS